MSVFSLFSIFPRSEFQETNSSSFNALLLLFTIGSRIQ